MQLDGKMAWELEGKAWNSFVFHWGMCGKTKEETKRLDEKRLGHIKSNYAISVIYCVFLGIHCNWICCFASGCEKHWFAPWEPTELLVFRRLLCGAGQSCTGALVERMEVVFVSRAVLMCVCVCAHSNPTSQHFHISPSRGSWPKTKKGVFYSNNDPLFTQAWPTTALKKGPFPCLQLSELGRESRRTVVTGSKSGLSAGKRGEKDRGRRRGGERESGSGFLASWCSARLVKALIQPAFSCYSTGWKPLLLLRLYDSKTGFPAKKRTN